MMATPALLALDGSTMAAGLPSMRISPPGSGRFAPASTFIQGGLAGAVLAHQHVPLAAISRELHVVQRANGAESLRNVTHLEVGRAISVRGHRRLPIHLQASEV